MKNILKKYWKEIVAFVILSIFYFLIPVFLYPDSVDYFKYLDIFKGNKLLGSWDVVRGFSFPATFYLSTIIFGENNFALVFNSYLFYVVYLLCLFYIYNKILKNIKNKIIRIDITVLYFLLLVYNPVIFGYFHCLLTEYVAIPLGLVSCIISYKYLNSSFLFKDYKSYLYILFYVIIFVYCWFLKQPYLTIIFFPLLLVIFLSIFKYKSYKDFISRFVCLLLCIIVLIISIYSWKRVLIKAGVDYESGRNSNGFIKEGMINAIKNFSIEENEVYYDENIIKNDKMLDKNEYINIKQNEENFFIVNVYNNKNEVIDKMFFTYDGDNYSIKDALSFILKSLIKHPGKVIGSYIDDYLAIIDIFPTQVIYKGEDYKYKIIRKVSINYDRENDYVGLAYLHYDNNFVPTDLTTELPQLSKNIHIGNGIKYIIMAYAGIVFILFKLLYLLLPIVFLISLFMLFKKKNKYMELAFIFIGLALFHVLFHVVFGASIDRYAFVVFPEVLIGYVYLVLGVQNSRTVNID